MSNEGLVEKRNGKYSISWKGKILLKAAETIEKTLNVIDKNRDFWNSHDLSCIPEDLLLKLGDIENYTIVKNRSKDVFGYAENFSKIVMDANEVRAILGFYIPHCVDELIEASKTIPVSIIASKRVFPRLDKEKLLSFHGKLLFREKLDLICITSDKSMCLGLPDKEGFYDISCILVSNSFGAVRWGAKLFDYFIKALSTDTL